LCDQLLDYVYGELDDAQKQAFEAHLPSCARCQPEVVSFGRTRQAAKRLMPAVEPPANLTGALHAQLMHAASQRRPKRGVVLQLFRRVAQHPQMAAAAMFLVVGGAFVLAWQKGKVLPAASPPTPAMRAEPAFEAAKPTESGSSTFDKMAANPPTGMLEGNSKGLEQPTAKSEQLDDHFQLAESPPSTFKNKEAAPAVYEGKKGGKLVLQTPSASYAVAPPSARHHASASGGAAPKATRAVAKDADDDMVLLSPGGGIGAGGGLSYGRGDAAKSTAPDTPALARAQNTQAPAAPPPAPPSVAAAPMQAQAQPSARRRMGAAESEAPQAAFGSAPAPSPVSSRQADSSNGPSEKAPVMKLNTTPATPNVENQRKQFNELARTNRCDEAIKLFHDLEHVTQFISPSERAQYVRCLMQKGRQQEAEQQLIELKADKAATNSEVQRLQEELDGVRPKPRRAEKKSKAAPPVVEERASEPPRDAQQVPVEASPPPAAAPSRPSAPAKSDRSKKALPAF
jgi:hypothetical protein